MLSLETNTDRSALLFFRHAQSKYTGVEPDITREGVDQLYDLRDEIAPCLPTFDRIHLLSADHARTKGSIKILAKLLAKCPEAEHLKIMPEKARILNSLRGLDVKDPEGLLEYEKEHGESSTITDNYLMKDNPYTEGTLAVDKRTMRFLYHYPRFIQRKNQTESEESDQPIKSLTLISTTFEPISYCALGAFPGRRRFPVKNQPLIKNTESVYVGLAVPEEDIFVVGFRNIEHLVKLNYSSGIFNPYPLR